MRPNQTIATFFNFIKNAEKAFDKPIVDGFYRINFYYAKLPVYIRNKLVEGDVLKTVTNTEHLIEHAMRYEQTAQATATASRQPNGLGPANYRRGSVRSRGNNNFVPRSNNFRGRGRGGASLYDLPIDEEAAKRPIAARFLDDNKMSLYKPHTLRVAAANYAGEERKVEQLF
ncbi:hypothetical protein LTR17_013039 [Elasticomyces elasticus]|nr:hypothetical protein LTR17_013039 [Elasticomyces elasticus]